MTPRRLRGWRARLRGMALVLTLFTVAVLVTLTTSFAIMAFNESKGSRSSNDGKVAYQFAVSGVDAMMAYMGANINWAQESSVPDPITGIQPAYILVNPSPVASMSPWPGVIYYEPTSPPSPVKLPISITSATQAGPSGVTNPTFTWNVSFNKGNGFAVDAEHDATLTMVVQRCGLPGDPDALASPTLRGGDLSGDTSEVYLMQSTATLYQSGSTTPIARRTVLARIREVSSTDNSLFIQASTFFDAPGLAYYFTNVTNPTALAALNKNFNDLAGTGGIPFGAQYQGQITVLNGPSQSQFTTTGQTGALTLWGNGSDFTSANLNSGNVTTFGGNVSLGQGQGGIQFPDMGGASPNGLDNGVFKGGDSTAQGNELPGSMPSQNAVTQYSMQSNSLVTGNLSQDTMITVNSDSASDFGTVQPLASGRKAPTLPVGHDIEVAVDASGNPIDGAPPGIANVDITLNNPSGGDGGSMTIQLVGAYSGAPVPFGPNDFPGVTFEAGSNPAAGTVVIGVNTLDQVNGGVLYVDGGNVEVGANQSGGNGGQDISGNLTIVAAGSSQRPTVDTTDPMDPALVIYDGGNATQDSITGKSIYLDPDNTNFFPDGSSGAVFPIQSSSGIWYWPAWDPNTLAQPTVAAGYDLGNSTTGDTMLSRDDATTREGNLTITSSIEPNGTEDPSLGLLADNYIFLSDQTNPADNTLGVDATLQSLSHSVEWGGFNDAIDINPNDPTKSGQTAPGAYYVGMDSGQVGTKASASTWGIPPAPNRNEKFTTEAAAGHFNLNGSVVSPFIDVEGTFMEGPPGSFVGYPNQVTSLNQHSLVDPPPFLPNFTHDVINNPSNALIMVGYRIERITDLGSLSGH